MRFILVSDPKFPIHKSWWVIRVSKGDYQTVTNIHKWIATDLFIKDGRDPHMQAARDRDDPIAWIRHPVMLGAGFLSTAMKLTERGDFYINMRGGMRPVGDLTELKRVDGTNWPDQLDPTRRITISTWGNHFYLTSDCGNPITFLDKFNTEEEAMSFALLFAPADRITLKCKTAQFKEGD